jgi:hypothetical protein
MRKGMRTATVLTGIGTLGAIGLASAGSAAAGANGQEVYFYNPSSSHVQICGGNQSGHHVCTPWFSVGRSRNVNVVSYWWKGKIWIYGHNNSAQITCSVPSNYGSNWFYCGYL